MKQLPKLKDKMLLLVSGPDWIPSSGELELIPLYIDKGSYQYGGLSMLTKTYILLNTIGVFGLILTFSYFMSHFTALDMVGIGLLVMLTLVITGRLLEHKRIVILEFLRLLLIGAWIYNFMVLGY